MLALNLTSRLSWIAKYLVGFLLVQFLWSLLVDQWHTPLGRPSLQEEGNRVSTAFVRNFRASDPSAWASAPVWTELKFIFAFGDEYTDTCFEPEESPPNEKDRLGNHARTRACTRPSHARWINYFLNDHGSNASAYNFAYSGAAVNDSMSFPTVNATIPFAGQINTTFESKYQSHPSDVQWSADDSLFIIWIGTVDFWAPMILNAERHPDLEGGITAYETQLQKLYDSGARHFLLINVPGFDRANTKLMDETSLKLHSVDIEDYNAQMKIMRNRFMHEHPGSTAHLFDVNRLWRKTIRTPTMWPQTKDLKNTTNYCTSYVNVTDPASDLNDPDCPAPLNEMFWRDSMDVTDPVHQLTAFAIVEDCFKGERKRNCL